MRQRALLAFTLPLVAAGCLAGHSAGYAVAGMSRRDLLVHGYLGYAPHFVAACVALVAVALVLRVSSRLQGRPAAWPFALLPALAFCAQELIERLAAGLPAHAVLEPAVYAGLAAQLPVALLAYLAARALLRVADEAAQALVPRPPFALRGTGSPAPAGVLAPVPAPLALDRLGRAPPRR